MTVATLPVRGEWRWKPEQDVRLFRRRHVDGAKFKEIAFEFARSENIVCTRFNALHQRLETAHGDVLAKHRQEEAELLEQMLAESRLPSPEERE